MKKLLSLSAFVFILGISNQVNAQSTAKEVGKDIKKGAKKAGHKTAEIASKGRQKSRINVTKTKLVQTARPFILITIRNFIG